MSTTETTPERFASDFLALLESARPEGIDELLAELEQVRTDLEPLLDRADEMLERTRAVAHHLMVMVSERDHGAAMKVEDFINHVLRRSMLFDLLSDLALEVDPEEMYRRNRLAEEVGQ